MNIDLELKNHLICEFVRHGRPSVLLETRGIVDGIDDMVRLFSMAIEDQVKRTAEKRNGEATCQAYTEKDIIIADAGWFFKRFNLTVTMKVGDTRAYSGGIEPSSIKKDLKTGEWICSPDISLKISGKDEGDLRDIFAFCLGHELTHAWNLYRYSVENDQESLSLASRQGYFGARNLVNNRREPENVKTMGLVFYKLTRLERNAYLAQLRQELMGKREIMKDAKSVMDAIKSTESWRTVYDNLYRNILVLTTLTHPQVKKEITYAAKEATGIPFKNYGQVLKWLTAKWEKWKKAYLVKASKIAYDVFAKDNINETLDWGMMGKDLVIKE